MWHVLVQNRYFSSVSKKNARGPLFWDVMIFLQCGFSSVSSNCLPKQMHTRIGCTSTIFLQSAVSNVSSKQLPTQWQNHIGRICDFFWVNFQVCPQTCCLNRCVITFIGFVWLVSSVNFHVCFIARRYRCIVAYIEFEWFLSRMSFQMCSQITWRYKCIVANIAFDSCPEWVFRCPLKLLASADAKLHWLHLWDFSPEWDFMSSPIACSSRGVIALIAFERFSRLDSEVCP